METLTMTKLEEAVLDGKGTNLYEFLDNLGHFFNFCRMKDVADECFARAKLLRQAMTDESGLFPIGERRAQDAKALYERLK